jgi:hypothetical protein
VVPDEPATDHDPDRRAHLRALFGVTVDAYVTALREGYPEVMARAPAHLMANTDFARQGWTDLMEPRREALGREFERCDDFCERHSLRLETSLGELAPAGGLPDASETPEIDAEVGYPHLKPDYGE